MTMPQLGLAPGDRKAKNFQLGFVVDDLEAALEYWTQTIGVGPFVVMRVDTQGRRVVHRGREIALRLDIAVAYMGDVQIELIHQICDTPSPFTEFMAQGGRGLHHIAFWVEEFPQDIEHLAACGFTETTAFHGADDSRGVMFFESPDLVGTLVELVPATSEKAAYFDRLRTLGCEWDGTTAATRRFANVAEFMASGQGIAR